MKSAVARSHVRSVHNQLFESELKFINLLLKSPSKHNKASVLN